MSKNLWIALLAGGLFLLSVAFACPPIPDGGDSGGGKKPTVFDLKFSAPAPYAPRAGIVGAMVAVSAADFDGDGYPDVAVVTGSPKIVVNPGSGNVSFFFNKKGDGTLSNGSEAPGTSINPSSAVVAPFAKSDGLGFAIPGSGSAGDEAANSITILYNKGAGKFGTENVSLSGKANSSAIAAGYFRPDLKPPHIDLAVANSTVGGVMVLFGKSDGKTYASPVVYSLPLTALSPRPVGAIAAGELDSVIGADLVITDAKEPKIWTMPNDGEGKFSGEPSSYKIPGIANDIALEDFNGDKILDVAVAMISDGTAGGLSILTGNDDETLDEDGINMLPDKTLKYVMAADMNGDGAVDLVVANNTDTTVDILLNKKDGTFADPFSLKTNIKPVAIGIADFNGDRHPDLAVITQGDESGGKGLQVFLSE